LCKGKSPGRLRIADDTVETVRRSYMLSPQKSTNLASRESDIPLPTVWKILRKPLKMRPYKIQLLCKKVTKRKCVRFCTDFQARVDEDGKFLSRVVFSDETSHLSGHVNHHKVRIWGG
jgi:hypothetical protein